MTPEGLSKHKNARRNTVQDTEAPKSDEHRACLQPAPGSAWPHSSSHLRISFGTGAVLSSAAWVEKGEFWGNCKRAATARGWQPPEASFSQF